MKNINYDEIITFLNIWDRFRFTDQKLSNSLILQHLFQIQPYTKEIFKASPFHAEILIFSLDSIFQLLGPDFEFVEKILSKIGQKHKAFNIRPSSFSFMGRAILLSMKDVLGQTFSKEEQETWENVYDGISNEIIKNMLNG